IYADRRERIHVTDLTRRQKVGRLYGRGTMPDMGIPRTFVGHPDPIRAMAAGPGMLVTGGFDREFRFWDWDTGRCFHRLRFRGHPITAAVSADGEWLAASCGKTVHVYRMVTLPRHSHPQPEWYAQLRGHT